MSDESFTFNSPVSPDGSANSPELIIEETTDTTNDQDITTLIAGEESSSIATIATNNDGLLIEMGYSHPSQVTNSPVVGANNQPVEIDGPHGQPGDDIPYLPGPINMNIAEDDPIQLSPGLQIFPVHINMVDDDIFLIERDMVAEPLEHEGDDIQVLHTERTAIETVEGPARCETANDRIHTFPDNSVIINDLTQDDEGEVHQVQSASVVPPLVIDLTGDDSKDEVPQLQLTSETGHMDDNEQIDQTGVTVPITERLPPLRTSSSEATDQNTIFATAIDMSHQTIEMAGQLQVPTALFRGNKRSSSSPEMYHANKKLITNSFKLYRRPST